MKAVRAQKVILITMMVIAYLIAIPFAFLMGMKYHQFHEYHKSNHIKGYCSKAETDERIGELHGLEYPNGATDIYYYDASFLISSIYWLALTFQTHEDCEAYLQKHYRVSFDELKESAVLPEEFLRLEDLSLERRQGWDIMSYQEFLVYDNKGRNRLKIAYVPEISRLFIFYRGGS